MELFEENKILNNSCNQLHERISKKKHKKPSIEAIQVTIEKKKQCIAKALDIVTRFSEGIITETCLIENLQFINQEQYQDIVEERAINKICGYPPCSSHLQNIPTKKYHISTSHNKVFDITDRKNFCSNMCYKASKYLKDQILTSPLWLRENIPPVSYKLISRHCKGGTVGDEVDLGFTPVKVDDDDCNSRKGNSDLTENPPLQIPETTGLINTNKSDNKVTDCSTKTEEICHSNIYSSIDSKNVNSNLHIAHVSEPEDGKLTKCKIVFDEIPKSSKTCDLGCLNDKVVQNSNETETKCEKIDHSTDIVAKNVLANRVTTKSPNKESNVSKQSNHKGRKEKNIDPQSKNLSNSGSSIQFIVRKIEQTLRDWFSIDSFCFIFGEEKLKEILAEKHIGDTGLHYLGSKTMDTHVYEKYLAICKKLNVLEIEDTKMDMSFKEEFKKPLPDYDALKKETKEMELKVKTFYKGDKIVQFDESDKAASECNEPEPNLPLVDLHAQKALRRRIVIDKIKRVLQDLQKSLCLRGFSLFEEIQRLVSTFDLASHNITMRPVEWNLMTILIIKLLSVKDKTLEQAMNSNPTNKNLTLLLMTYSIDSAYLDRLIVWLSDIEYVLQKNS